MANNYTSPDKTASVAFRPNGIYAGIVTRVDTGLQRVWVMIPRIANGFQFGPLSVATTILPIVGDRVACMFVEDRQDDLVILGSLKNSNSPLYTASITCTSTTRPTDPPVGTQIYETDTTKTLIWNGSSWTGLNIDTLLVDNNTLYIDATNNRVGVNTGTPTVALDVVGAIKASTSITATTTVSAYDVTATGTVSGASVTASGPVSGASISASGVVSGGSISTSGTAQVGTLTSSGVAQATRLTLTQTTGTAPLTISSTTLVSNLNADLLDGQHGSYYAPPIGTIAIWAGAASGGTAPFYTSLPTGYCLCDGSPLDRTLYSALYAAIGTRYGTTLSSNFLLPSFSSRLASGLAAGATPTVPTTLSSGNQSANHSHTITSNAGNQSASHKHNNNFNSSGRGQYHTHGFSVYYNGGNLQGKTTGNDNEDHIHLISGDTGDQLTSHSHTITSNAGDQSANHTHAVDVVQIYFVIRYQ